MQLFKHLKNDKETQLLGEKLADVLSAPFVIGLKGSIGMGKTTLTRAMLQRMGVHSAVKSPTFNLVETYSLPMGEIHHFDLYRLTSEYDLEDLGFRDYLASNAIVCIEWPENAPSLADFIDLMIEFSIDETYSGRNVLLSAHTNLGKTCLEKL